MSLPDFLTAIDSKRRHGNLSSTHTAVGAQLPSTMPLVYEVVNRSSGVEETKTKGRDMTRQEIDQYFAELERAGLFVKTGQLRQGQPVYVASEWGVKLRHDHPDLFNQIINTCDDLDVLQQIYDQHKDVLAKYRQ
jgi:hypothetical protein